MNSNKKLAIASLGSDENAKKTSEEKADTGIRVSNIISMNEVTIFLGDDHIKEVIKSNYNRLRHLFDRYNIIIKDKQDERIRLMKIGKLRPGPGVASILTILCFFLIFGGLVAMFVP